ncbi:hypothetical protein [Wenjunlia tyrosinilytica]|uniref:hypothetical protein n=1 Tax=Wenjunlia tyrosinilytica TaxID=1544741 RepID=UPI001666404F|nr:hypothetical protein [Wenjunlia tyrosinilytica]
MATAEGERGIGAMKRAKWVRTGSAVAAALWLVAAWPGSALAGSGSSVPAYRTAEGAKKVEGAESSADGPSLTPGIYTDSIGRGQKLYYSVALDEKSNAYLSAVAAPRPGARVAYGDGVKVTLESTDNTSCGQGGDPTFEADRAVRPIADYAAREIEQDGSCQEAGTYLLAVERTSAISSDQGRWPIEIRFMTEPGVKAGTSGQPGEASWSSATPTPPIGEAKVREGGTGFNDASVLAAGVWKDRLSPGETHFFAIPVDWGQQLFATAEFANAPATGHSGFSAPGARIELYNSARGQVIDDSTSYTGEQTVLRFGTAPAAYANRFSDHGRDVTRMRFAGRYYLAVSVHPDVARLVRGKVPVTLRLTVRGKRQQGPTYIGDPVKAGFGLSGDDGTGTSGGGAGKKLIGFAGIGAGTVLVLCLGGWALVSRRRVAADSAPPRAGEQFGPPPAW